MLPNAINTTITDILLPINNEIDKYFISLERTILDYFKDINIYEINNDMVLNLIIKDLKFKDFIKKIQSMLNDNFTFNLKLDMKKILVLQIDDLIFNEYKLSYFFIKAIEKSIDEIIDKNISSYIKNKPTKFVLNKFTPSQFILSITGLSSNSYFKRHQVDIYKRTKGNLLNIKYRLKRELRKSITDNLSIKIININSKTA